MLLIDARVTQNHPRHCSKIGDSGKQHPWNSRKGSASELPACLAAKKVGESLLAFTAYMALGETLVDPVSFRAL